MTFVKNQSSIDEIDISLKRNSSKNCCESIWSILKPYTPQINLPSPSARATHDIENGAMICELCEKSRIAIALVNPDYFLHEYCDHVKKEITAEEKAKKSR